MKPPSRSAIPKKIAPAPTPNDPSSEADGLAAEILAFFAEDEARILRFFDLTGLTPQSLRRAAARPDFSASVIEYLAADDRLFLAFATSRGLDPAKLEGLRRRLAPRDVEAD